ncbi:MULTISPECIES: hypothetical protein [unclassified Meiothermus]|uniref:hypothetical protein n=1 Tax=unclassified Meiothermus TaxID=370471 RepID=UPI000D7BBFAF|nr:MULTISPECIES: hypothetical protein [unclassified Meiothermus]PZA07593.1 hypothetical protein DNA98_08235 [Meiothermus sp. Pnk-1]RYM36809.1 hypothetical protein EWH23_08485 [Meiothermus sp. PNK-Is4]
MEALLTGLILLRGLAALVLLVGLALFALLGLRLLLREPTAREFRVFRFLAWTAIAQVGLEVVLGVFGLRNTWLHLTYGTLTAALLHFVGGLEAPQGWFRRSLHRPPEKVGPYLFWASFIALLLSLRFLATR